MLLFSSCSENYVEVANFNNDSLFLKNTQEDDYSIIKTPTDCGDSIVKRLSMSTQNCDKILKKYKLLKKENEYLEEQVFFLTKERDELIDEINKERSQKNYYKDTL